MTVPDHARADAPATKAALRARMAAVAPATPAESRAVTGHLCDLEAWSGAAVACLFLPMPGELDVAGLPGRLPKLAWVVTRTPASGGLTVHPLDAPRERHRWGFEQPVADAPTVPPHAIDVFVVPGVAFDEHGHRLGHGAGYYDRLLSAAHDQAVFVAVTLRRRLLDRVPTEAHDVTMHAVVTEHGPLQLRRPDPGHGPE